MRILLVAPMPPSRAAPGAIPRVLYAQLVGLSERHDVSVACVAGPEEHELEAATQLQEAGWNVCVASRREPRTPVERWSRRRRLGAAWLRGDRPWRSVWFHEPSLQAALDGMTAQHALDVIAVEDNAMGAYRYPPGVAAVMTEHEVRRPRRLAVPRGGKGWPRALVDELDWQRWLRYQRVTWGRFALVQTFTNRDATALQSVAPELAGRVRVTPFGLDVPERLPHARSSRMLTFVGNFTHAPNVDAALWLGRDVMPKLRELGPAARLRIVGPCAPPAVAALAAQDIEVLGEVHDLASIMAETAVVLAPVRIGGGMRVKVVEALSLGKAVVTTPRGAEGLRLGAPVLIGRDAGELAAHARALLVDTERRAALEQEAHDYAVAHHSPRAYASRLEDVYEEAVGRAAIPVAAAR